MKTTLKNSLQDRAYVTPLAIGGILLIILFIMGASHIRYSELQVPVRYSSFGITNFYREQWFYQLAFMAFGAVVFVFHALLGARLMEKKGRSFAIAFAWLTVIVLAITVMTVGAIFKVAGLV